MAVFYFQDTVQINSKPTKEEIKELNQYFEENPSMPFRLYWFEEKDNLSFLKNLKNITKLHVNYSTLKDFDFLQYFPDLEELDISEMTGTPDISAIGNLTSLKVLNLDLKKSGRQVSLEHLKDLTNLEEFYFLGKFKKNSLDLLRFNKLKILCPMFNGLDISSLHQLPHLHSLYLDGQSINNLEGIQGIASLKYVRVRDIKIPHQDILTPIFELPGLETLFISYVKAITDFTFMRYQPTVKELYLWTLNGLQSINGVEQLECLETYSHCGEHAHKNEIDFSALLKLKKLKQVEVKIGIMNKSAQKNLDNIQLLIN